MTASRSPRDGWMYSGAKSNTFAIRDSGLGGYKDAEWLVVVRLLTHLTHGDWIRQDYGFSLQKKCCCTNIFLKARATCQNYLRHLATTHRTSIISPLQISYLPVICDMLWAHCSHPQVWVKPVSQMQRLGNLYPISVIGVISPVSTPLLFASPKCS